MQFELAALSYSVPLKLTCWRGWNAVNRQWWHCSNRIDWTLHEMANTFLTYYRVLTAQKTLFTPWDKIFCWETTKRMIWVAIGVICRFRVACHGICVHPYWGNFILVCILISSSVLATEDPLQAKSFRNQVSSFFVEAIQKTDQFIHHSSPSETRSVNSSSKSVSNQVSSFFI